MSTLRITGTATWQLVEWCEDESQRRPVRLPTANCVVGRGSVADIRVAGTSVSKQHARLEVREGHLFVEDLGSTNGTYVNGVRIASAELVEDDLLQLGNELFRVMRDVELTNDATQCEGVIPWVQTLQDFDRLISEPAVVPYFQPIVSLSQRDIQAYELLIRSHLPEMKNPAAMFSAAERLGQQATLSEIARSVGMQVAMASNQHECRFFLNTHPVEIVTDRLLDSLASLREDYPAARIAIEIHEAAVTDLESMRRLGELLEALDMQLAYDDFGAGQGRLLELCEVPPQVLKFDMQLIRGIDRASTIRREMMRSLVNMAHDLGATPLAEGIETEQEHQACVELGFQLGQGFLYAAAAPFETD